MLGDARRRDDVRDESGRILAADRVEPPRHGVDMGEQVVLAIIEPALHRELAHALDGVGQDRVIVDADQKRLARRARGPGREQVFALVLLVDALIRECRDQLGLGDDRNLLDVVPLAQMRGLEARRLVLGAIDRDLAIGHLDQFLDPRELLGADLGNRQIGMLHAGAEIIFGRGDQLRGFLIAGLKGRARVLGFPELQAIRRRRVRGSGLIEHREIVAGRNFGHGMRYGIHRSSPLGFSDCSGPSQVTVAIPRGVVALETRSYPV